MRYHIANTLYRLFPSRFCWADLVRWSQGIEPFFSLVKYFKKPLGCIIDSKVSLEKDCYCGSWNNGHHCTSKEGREMMAEKETEELITDEPPF